MEWNIECRIDGDSDGLVPKSIVPAPIFSQRRPMSVSYASTLYSVLCILLGDSILNRFCTRQGVGSDNPTWNVEGSHLDVLSQAGGGWWLWSGLVGCSNSASLVLVILRALLQKLAAVASFRRAVGTLHVIID